MQAWAELFPLFSATSAEVLAELQSQATERDFAAGRAVLMEDAWGNAVYFVMSGWLKVRSIVANQESTTLAILGRGSFFGEMAVLDELPRSTDVVSYTEVRVLSLTAGVFTELLMKDGQTALQMLKLMAQRVRRANQYSQLRSQVPAVRVANVLVELALSYGAQLFLLPPKDMADLAHTGVEEVTKILEKLGDRQWLVIDQEQQTLTLTNLKQLNQLAQTRS
jgi:CRP-like cAMP-binding protein